MNKLPLLISVPHAGLAIPPEVEPFNLLTSDQIIADGDEGAREIYAIEELVNKFITTDIARAFVDMNRKENDFSRDGVVKTHTCWSEPVYKSPLSSEIIKLLLERYYFPYHRQLIDAADKDIILAIDCHTMASAGPPVGPDHGSVRPMVCLSNADGTCHEEWFYLLADCLSETFCCEVSLNKPFKGGYIIRRHSREISWLQLELSRNPSLSIEYKRNAVISALKKWCKTVTKS
ncbi:N-formylglutamate amidohydrolase [Candidatus Scalindua japonica]|uniref:N-formylglutamate amidohydrolase n=1 Tax=Candidatus Scalindua japonica TaxID=1284222 RepID=UPI000BDF65FB|nr:N-formylglutamate amidohydrolase [Candidatus Scalindua japonica]